MSAVIAPAPSRLVEIDRLRGLAIACMVVDHLALFGFLPWEFRITVGRLAMPLFFVLAGMCFSRLTRRHGQVFVIGLVLPLAAPWLDAPNVLVWIAVGAVVLWLMDRPFWVAGHWLVIFAALAAGANHWTPALGTGYPPGFLVAFMALGRLLAFRGDAGWLLGLGERLPGVLAGLGRRPLSMYVGHVLALEVLRRVLL